LTEKPEWYERTYGESKEHFELMQKKFINGRDKKVFNDMSRENYEKEVKKFNEENKLNAPADT